MADTKISGLTALTDAVNDDLLAIVDSSTTTTKKITLQNLLYMSGGNLWLGTNAAGIAGGLGVRINANGNILGNRGGGNKTRWSLQASGTDSLLIDSGEASAADGQYGFCNGSGTLDTAILRVGVGVLKVTNGTSGTGWLQNAAGRSRVTTAAVTNATDTMAAITGLSATLVAGRKYTGRMVLFVSTDQAAEGAKFDFDGGAGTWTSFRAALVSNAQGATAGVTVSAALATDLTFTALSGTTVHCLEFAFSGVCNAAGTFIPQFSQVAHASGTLSVLVDSYLWLEDTP